MRCLLPIFAFVGTCFAVGLPSVSADTALQYTSTPDDYISRFAKHSLTPDAQTDFSVRLANGGNQVSVSITEPPSAHSPNGGATTLLYTMLFGAPTGTRLAVGTYNYPGVFSTNTTAGFEFFGDGTSDPATGQFRVTELTSDASGNLLSFAADFSKVDSNHPNASCYGWIEYNSALPHGAHADGSIVLAAAQYHATAENGAVAVTVRRVGGSAGALAVNYATADGTALAGRDYAAVSGTLSWADGDTADQTVAIPLLRVADPARNNDGAFVFNLSGAATGALSQATVHIVNDTSATTLLHLVSDQRDFIGAGADALYNIANQYTVAATRNTRGGVSISVKPDAEASTDTKEFWTLDFGPPDGLDFGVGDYQNVVLYFSPASQYARMTVEGDGRHASNITGSFQVREAVFDADGSVQRLAIDFEQHNSGTADALHGQVRYNSAVPVMVPVVTVTGDPPAAGDGPGTVKAFTISRTGGTAAALTVTYQMAGKGINGVDYQGVNLRKIIRAGQSSARVLIRPLAGGQPGTPIRVKLKLLPEEDRFHVTGNGVGKVTIERRGN